LGSPTLWRRQHPAAALGPTPLWSLPLFWQIIPARDEHSSHWLEHKRSRLDNQYHPRSEFQVFDLTDSQRHYNAEHTEHQDHQAVRRAEHYIELVTDSTSRRLPMTTTSVTYPASDVNSDILRDQTNKQNNQRKPGNNWDHME
jgi:hypothetical protein